jgi:hypothetical protein
MVRCWTRDEAFKLTILVFPSFPSLFSLHGLLSLAQLRCIVWHSWGTRSLSRS